MITDKNFRLHRSTKVVMACATNSKEYRNIFKNLMIDAQVSEEKAKKAALKSKDKKVDKDFE